MVEALCARRISRVLPSALRLLEEVPAGANRDGDQ
jgi:hypothetical protein